MGMSNLVAPGVGIAFLPGIYYESVSWWEMAVDDECPCFMLATVTRRSDGRWDLQCASTYDDPKKPMFPGVGAATLTRTERNGALAALRTQMGKGFDRLDPMTTVYLDCYGAEAAAKFDEALRGMGDAAPSVLIPETVGTPRRTNPDTAEDK